MSDIAIRVADLGKQYRIGGPRARYRTIRESVIEATKLPFRRLSSTLRGEGSHADGGTIWALKDVSFEVERGEVVGIIGRNGAGKSTLLKVLSRITEPTEGWAEIHGRVGSLLEVGTGFHPELTGRENIYLSGTVLGMRRGEIDRRFDEIVAFSGVEQFLDTPLKHYSSGMQVRLGFAVAAHLEPEILLVDEVLAVGDAEFQKKCLGKMGEVARGGRTVLFVSHNMGAVRRLCSRVLLFHKGHLHHSGEAEQVISNYLVTGAAHDGHVVWAPGISQPGVIDFHLDEILIRDVRGMLTSTVETTSPFTLEIRYRLDSDIQHCRVGVILSTPGGVPVFETYDADDERYTGRRSPGMYVSTCTVPADLLNSGQYIVSVNAGIPPVRSLAYVEGALLVDVRDTGAVGSHLYAARVGVVRPRLHWSVKETESCRT
jgi:lipopolysaccharide transport system ATP-binding protein